MRGREELKRDVLAELRISTQGSPPTPEDEEIVDNAIDPFFAQLRVGRIYPNANPDRINDSEYYPMTIILAFRLQARFGKSVISELKAKRSENALRRQNVQPLNTNQLNVDRALRRPSREPFDGR